MAFVLLLVGTSLYSTRYYDATGPNWMGKKPELLDVFVLDRAGELKRSEKFKNIKHRRLLWHGTNVAVMVAILTTGLRIMPHSGGRVGRGIYFASENSKSAGYVRAAGGIGLMVLNEVAIGKQHEITQDDSSLRKAPNGYDSVIAQGRTEPDPKHEITLPASFGHEMIVAQGKPIDRNEFAGSSFFQSEYLVYDEGQNYMRYLLKFKWQ